MIQNQINVFGLTSEEIEQLQKVKANKDCIIFNTDCATDLIAMGAFATVIRKSALEHDDYDMLYSFFEEVGDYIDTTIIIGDDDKMPKLSKKIKAYPTFETFMGKAKYAFVTAYAKHKQSDEFSSKISLAIKILVLIKKKPGITTAAISEKLEISPRSVQRYIETLRMSGEWIDYDTSIRGWRLEYEKSLLLDFEDMES